MLLLALASRSIEKANFEMTRLVLQGDLQRAIQSGQVSLERGNEFTAHQRAFIGQLLGRCLLACGREEEAEDVFQQQLKVYGQISRRFVRWAAALDQATTALNLNRLGRAAEGFLAVAHDKEAPAVLQLQGMLGAAMALHRVGDFQGAWLSFNSALALAPSLGDEFFMRIVNGVGLELSVLQRERHHGGLDDHALCSIYREDTRELMAHDLLAQQLSCASQDFAGEAPLVARRMQHLAHLTSISENGSAGVAHAREGLEWLRSRRLSNVEHQWRAESALALVARGAMRAANELLTACGLDESQIRRSRYALELQYCLYRIYMEQGRLADALLMLKRHSQEAVNSLRTELTRRNPSSLSEGKAQASKTVDSVCLRLPLRYRRAYQYIIENLQNDSLSVHQVALHLGVTERALQMAFRRYLGMSPAELIRNRRVEHVREELCEEAGARGVLELANRWGIKSRSTLISTYRSRFNETPTQTLQGAAV